MIIIDGIVINTTQELESAIALFSKPSKTYFRDEFNGLNVFSQTKHDAAQLDLLNKRPKVYTYCQGNITKNDVNFIHIDFVTALSKKLFRKSYLVKGECQKEEFYEAYNAGVFSNLVVIEEHVFTRDALGFASRRDTTVKWINNNESVNPVTKSLVKYYSQLEQIDEGKTRRGNLVDSLQMPVIAFIQFAMTGSMSPTNAAILEGRRFLFDYKIEFETFVGESNKEIISCLNTMTNMSYATSAKYSWIDSMTPLNVTIRNYLISQLTI